MIIVEGQKVFRPSMKTVWLASAVVAIFCLFFFFLLPLIPVFIIFFYLKIKNTWVEIKEEGLMIYSGILAKKRSLLLFSQIQDINENQNFFSILFGIKNLRIVTMTALSAQAGNLPAFEASDAAELKQIVISRINAEEKQVEKKTVAEKAQYLETFAENYFPLRGGKFAKATIMQSIIGLAFIVIIAGARLILSEDMMPGFFFSFFLVIPVIGFVIIIAIISAFIRTSGTKYRIGEKNLEIEFSFLSTQKITLPFQKIQDLVLKKSFFERIVGIATLKAQSGALDLLQYSNSEKNQIRINEIPALLVTDALELRNILARKMGCSIEEKKPSLVESICLESIKPLKKTVSGSLGVAVLFAIAIGVMLFIMPESIKDILPMQTIILWAILLFVVIIIAKFAYELAYLKNYYYNLTPEMLLIRKGVFNINEIVLPFEKIQNVFVDQDIFDKLFGLWDVHVSTVTIESDIQAHIDGLNEQNAKIVSDILLKEMKKQN